MHLNLYREIYSKIDGEESLPRLISEYSGRATELNITGISHRKLHALTRRSVWRFEALKGTPSAYLSDFYHRLANDDNSSDYIIIKMAEHYAEVPPCFLARTILKAYCAAKNKGLLENATDMEVRPVWNAGKLFKAPQSIEDESLRRNVIRCQQVDPFSSPEMDLYRSEIGICYENILQEKLRALQIPFLDETKMRKLGYARTPDTILIEPVAVDGQVVKWIESKAWFGDPESHAIYLRDQYWPYYNRFGPGLVIYWFGFVEESTAEHRHKGVAVMDSMPDPSRISRIESSLFSLIDKYLLC